MRRRTKRMMDGGVSSSPISAFDQSQSPSYGGAGLGNMAPLVQIGSDMAGAMGGAPGGGGLLNIGMPAPMGAAAPMPGAPMRKGGAVKKMAKGGAVKKMRSGGACGMKGGGKVRGGGCETKGRTRGRFV
jgi:hypothetical protein